jgi:hypothetical protein
MAKFTGILKQPIIDFQSGRLTLLFEPNEDFRETYEELKGCDKLSLEIRKYRVKRSLDANAYYWTLITKLATVLETSNAEQHNRMLALYGYPEIIDGKHCLVVLPDTEDAQNKIMKAEEYHLKPTSDVREGNDGKSYRTYVLLRGSRTYNTEEMARLINGLISECKDARIPDSEIAAPDEKRILKERYGVDIG